MASTNVLMVFPRFNQNSFWSLQAACDLYGVKCPAPPLGMITLAALLPKEWTIKLVNRNAEELQTADLDWADIVMTGGMLPQRDDTQVVIDLAHARGKPTAVGGPDPMSSPECYEKSDFRVLGEAEGIIHLFVDAWNRGERSGTFEGERFKADITQSPIPRFDLINFKHYLYVGVQFSRGCPFTCEFCDIIELYGRAPRPKTNPQMLAELDALYNAGYRGHVDFVDDNLIGNKKALRRFLPALEQWQKDHKYPFEFSTEASMNLADDGELLEMLKRANFFAVFVGIESPDTDTLIATSKKQNTRRSLADSVHKIYDAGMFVIAGFIVGFDSEKGSMSRAMIACIEDTGIPVAMVGLLTALPNTQLTRRLVAEGRLLPFEAGSGDQCSAGLNYITLRPRVDILQDYKRVIENIYEPNAYFERVRLVGRDLKMPNHDSTFDWAMARHDAAFMGRLIWRMTVTRPDLRRPFWRTLTDTIRHNPAALQSVITMITFYLHLGAFAQKLLKELDVQIANEIISPRAPHLPAATAIPAPLKVAHYG
ncbi:MAG: B12-binding domain-containing radical SAM protein [Hyphomicrobiaceae bacterium]